MAEGRGETTTLPQPLAAPIADLIAALDQTALTPNQIPAGLAVTTQHPLQPFSAAAYFADGQGSFDVPNFNGASAVTREPKLEKQNRTRGFSATSQPAKTILVRELVSFFSHPARQLLKTHGNFTFREINRNRDEIPIELDALQKWEISRSYLDLARAGRPVAEITAMFRRSGVVAPDHLGTDQLRRLQLDAEKILASSMPVGEPRANDICVALSGCTLRGLITTVGDTLAITESSKLQPKHLLSAWIQLLALASSVDENWEAVLVSKAGVNKILSPDVEQARAKLNTLLMLYRYGIDHPLPALPRVNECYWTQRSSNQDPAAPNQHVMLEKNWNWDRDADWEAFFDFPQLLDISVPTDFEFRDASEPTFQGLLAKLIWEPIFDHLDAK
ncbi:MAG: hypothetical protein FWG47_07615 [Propionibacteriaceae bacterium]|nr:hypothetical protein [Propionibacteriaceae bacterium]